MSQDLVFTVEFNVKPQAKSEFLTSLNQVVENMANEDTFVASYLHADPNDPNRFLIYERWSEPSFEAFYENQLKGKSYRDDYENKVSEWLVKERGISVLTPLGQWTSELAQDLKQKTGADIMTSHLVFYVEFDVKPECIDRFLKGANGVLEAMSHEDTFIDTYLHQDSNDPNKFTLYERWNEPSMDAFMKNQLQGKSYRDEYEAYLPELLASPRKFTALESIGEWDS